MAKIKLPKQWKHWCRSAHLATRDYGYSQRPQDRWFYLRGHGREWRVNCHGMLQCGDTYADFDRWALCEIREVPLPKTRAGFLAAVQWLLAAQKIESDGCEVCYGQRGGTPGNENLIDGKRVCDYCHAEMVLKARATSAT